MTDREIMQQAYDAMNDLEGYRPNIDKAMLALHQALAQPEQESKPMYVMGNYAGEGKVVSASFGLPKGAFEFAPYTGNGEASKIKHSLEPQPEQEPDCGEAGHDEGRCGNFHCITKPATPPKPEQAPDAWLSGDGLELKQVLVKQNGDWVETPFSIGQPRKTWVGLTDDEIEDTWGNTPMMLNARDGGARRVFAHAIEAKLKELNK